MVAPVNSFSIALLATSAVFVSFPALAAEGNPSLSSTLTMDEAIHEGLDRSPRIQRAEAVVDENRARKREALGAGFLPHVSAAAAHYFDTKYQATDIVLGGSALTFPGIYPTTQFTLTGTIPIFDGLANVHHYESASLTQTAAEEELERARFELSENIRLAFYQALAADSLDEVAHQNVKTLEDHLRQIKIQRRGGTATSYDSLRVEVQLNEASSDAVDADDNVSLARKRLTVLLGLDQDDRPLQGGLPVPDASKVRSLEISGTPNERTDIRALDLRTEAAEREHSAQAVWLVPSISLGGQLVYYNELLYNNVVSDPGKYETAYNLGVFLTWNLFDGGVSAARTAQATARETEADRDAQAAKLQLPYDFSLWKKRYVSNSDHYQSKQLDVTRSQESVRLAKEEERAGTRTSTEVLDAELDLFRSKAGVVNSQLSAAEALIRLELAVGRRI